MAHGRQFLLNSMPKNCICAEIGVWTGLFSEMILNTIKPDQLFLIDPWIWDHKDIPFDNYIANTKIAHNQNDMDQIYIEVCKKFASNHNVIVKRQMSVDAAEEFDDETFDWIYLDGSHDYKSVAADIQAWKNKILIGGYFCFDDYDWGGKYKYPVRVAINELMKTKQYQKIDKKNGQFIAKRIK